MTRCGICHGSNNELFCSSCVNFQLLKPKLEYLELLNELSSSKNLVDQVLDKCIKGNNYPFMKQYIQGDHTLDIEGLSIGSIAALSSQLLTIDAMLLKRKNNKILKSISIIKSKKDSNSLRLETLKRKLQESNEVSKMVSYNDEIKSIQSQTKTTKENSLNIEKQINNSQSILFQELINLYLVKRKRLSGVKNQYIFMISFIPIINLENLLSFNFEIINASLERICKFIYQISTIWFINLPFQIEFNHQQQPSILNFKLFSPDSNIEQIHDLSNFELKLFLNGISRLILNIFEILQFFQLDNEIKLSKQLFNIDEMIYKIVNNNYNFNELSSDNDQSNPIKGNIDIDELTDLVYKHILNKINQKNNEWHVVQNDFLIDEDQ